MKHITFEIRFENNKQLDILDFEKFLQRIPDTRKPRGIIYPLSVVLTMIFVAKLSGMDKPAEITEWIRLRKTAFIRLFSLKHDRMPCLNTIRTILGDVVPEEEMEKAFSLYCFEKFGGLHDEHLAMDGKAMKGTIPKGKTRGVHQLSVFAPASHLVVKQIDVGEKTNEIGASTELLEQIDLKNKVLSADAMHTQRDFCVAVMANGGDYLVQVKKNQPKLLADIQQYFEPPKQSIGWYKPSLPQEVVETTNTGHGRVERRVLRVISSAIEYLNWPSVKQIYQIERHVTDKKSRKASCEISYGLTSCSQQKAQPEKLMKWIRGHWAIENGLHYRRDVTMKEDATRMKYPKMARVMSHFNNFIIAIMHKLGLDNLASARRQFDAIINRQLVQLSDY